MFRVIAFIVITISFFAKDMRASEVNTSVPQASERQAINALDEQYVQAFNAKDVSAAMQTFADDAVYVTDYGVTLRGKDDIQDTLQKQFEESGNSTLKLNVYSVDISPDAQKATERGVSTVTADGIQEPSSYVAEFVKKGGQWRVSRVVEQPQAASAERLQALAWMVGDWADQSEDVSVRTKSEWALDRAFITRRFAVTAPERPELKGIEYIGWDPVSKEIHSWYYDSQGGYGGGRWKLDGKSWTEEAVGITPDGETATATHIFTPGDTNSFTWRSINRKIGGEPQDDIPETTIQRVKNEQKGLVRE